VFVGAKRFIFRDPSESHRSQQRAGTIPFRLKYLGTFVLGFRRNFVEAGNEKAWASPDTLGRILARVLHSEAARMARCPLLVRVLHSETTRPARHPSAHWKTAKTKNNGAHSARIRGSFLSPEKKVEQIRETLADCSNLPTDEESLFLRHNDYWTIQYRGHAALLKSTRGLHYLVVLLREPGREFHVRELLAYPRASSTPAAVAAKGRVAGGLHAGVPVLDAQAKAEYERRITDLRQDLNQAERFNDLQRKTEVQNELQAIADHLASAVGLGGRDRRTSSDAERARSAVTKCIKKTVREIGKAIPSLGYHLAARIKTGYFCSYHPHPDRPVAWKF